MSAAATDAGLRAAVAPAVARAGDDAALLGAAVALEWVAAGTYAALARVDALAPAARRTLRRLAVQERDHAGLLASARGALAGGPRTPPPPAGASALARARAEAGLRRGLDDARTLRDVVAVAVELEDALTAAYRRTVARLRDPRLVTVTTQIMGAEAQHAVVVRGLLTDDPAALVPSAFGTGDAKIP